MPTEILAAADRHAESYARFIAAQRVREAAGRGDDANPDDLDAPAKAFVAGPRVSNKTV